MSIWPQAMEALQMALEIEPRMPNAQRLLALALFSTGRRQEACDLIDDACRHAKNENTHWIDRKSTRLNSSHLVISYAVFCLKKKTHTHSTSSRESFIATIHPRTHHPAHTHRTDATTPRPLVTLHALQASLNRCSYHMA